MTIAERFDRYIAARVRIDALVLQLRDLENEAKPDAAFVKDWFRARPERARYRGVNYSSTTYTRLDTKKARMLLGSKVAQAEVQGTRESLTLDAASKAVRDASAGLKPVRTTQRASA